jgi:MFS family permease
MFVGGEWASRRAANNERLQLKVTAIAYSGFGAVSAATYLASNQYVAFGLLALGIVGLSTVAGPMYATLQTLVPSRMRAISIALVFLCANLIGSGLGPLAAGVLSDALRPWFGEESLRYALLALSPGYLWTGWHLWQASKTVARDVQACDAEGVPYDTSDVPDAVSEIEGTPARASR